MVDTVTGFSSEGITTETVVRADNMLAEAGHLSAEGVMENIAQTCAARIGFVNRYILRRGIQVGFIGAIRNFHIHRLAARNRRDDYHRSASCRRDIRHGAGLGHCHRRKRPGG